MIFALFANLSFCLPYSSLCSQMLSMAGRQSRFLIPDSTVGRRLKRKDVRMMALLREPSRGTVIMTASTFTVGLLLVTV